MVNLQQRLRELSKESFESLIHQILLRKYPGGGIKKSEGTGGDQGIDSFSGNLTDGPAIWQCKHFPDRIRRSQKKQILESAKVAFEFHRPKRWTLCVPVDFRTEEHQWFQAEVINRYESYAKVGLMGASDILHELTYDRPLRDAFFEDNSISNALSIRQIALGTEKKSLEQKEQLTVQFAQQFLEGNLDLEPRLQPIMTIGLSCSPRGNGAVPGSVFSVRKGHVAIDYIPRNPETYNLDPMSLHVTLNRAHSNKLQKSIDTGQPFNFPVGAILKLDSQSPLLCHLFQGHDPAHLQMEIRPGIPPQFAKEYPMRLLSGAPLGTVELSPIPFKLTQFGRKEMTLTSCSRLPIEISIKLKYPPAQGANITIQPRIAGADAVEVIKVLEFLDGLEKSSNFEIFTLDPPGRLFSEAGKFSNRLNIPEGYRKALSQIAQISTHFGVPVSIPEEITRQDLRKIEMLMHIVTGEPLVGIEISANLIKESRFKDQAVSFLSGTPVSMRMENSTGWPDGQLFGQTVDIGPVAFLAETVMVVDGEVTLKKYLDAPEGALIDWKGACKGLCRFVPSRNPSQNELPGSWLFTSEAVGDDLG
jgi:hypothetical protein